MMRFALGQRMSSIFGKIKAGPFGDPIKRSSALDGGKGADH